MDEHIFIVIQEEKHEHPVKKRIDHNNILLKKLDEKMENFMNDVKNLAIQKVNMLKDIFELVNAIAEIAEENVKKVMNRFCLYVNDLDRNFIDKDSENILNEGVDPFL